MTCCTHEGKQKKAQRECSSKSVGGEQGKKGRREGWTEECAGFQVCDGPFAEDGELADGWLIETLPISRVADEHRTAVRKQVAGREVVTETVADT